MPERTALGYRCSHCGRPLPLRKVGLIACPECGGDNYVELPSGAALVSSPGAGQFLQAALAGSLLTAALAVGVMTLYRRAPPPAPVVTPPPPPAPTPGPPAPAPTPSPPSSPPAASSIVSWVGSGNAEGPCLADVDGDGALDVVGYGAAGGGVTLLGVAAASGEIVWRNGDRKAEDGLLCDGRGAVAVTSRRDFSVQIIDPRTGATRWSARLRDAPKALAFGDGCLTASAIDDSRTSFALLTGASAPCPSARPVPRRVSADRAPVEAAGLTITLSTVSKGSPRIVVTGARGGAKVWEQTLGIASDDAFGAVPRALSAAGLLVAGKVPGVDAMGVVLIDPASGRIAASREIAEKETHGTFFVRLAATDATAFLETFGKLYALRLPDLEPQWTAGSMW